MSNNVALFLLLIHVSSLSYVCTGFDAREFQVNTKVLHSIARHGINNVAAVKAAGEEKNQRASERERGK
jgi:hypothetical protein